MVGLSLLIPVLDKDLVSRPLHLCGPCLREGMHARDPGANIHVQKSLLWWEERREEA